MRAAIADARNWHGGSLEFEFRPTHRGVDHVRGAAGHLRVALVGYEGFEPVQRLVAAVVIDGNPIDPSSPKLYSSQHPRRLRRFERGERRTVDRRPRRSRLCGSAGNRERRTGTLRTSHPATGAIRRRQDPRVTAGARLNQREASIRKERRDQVVGSTARERIEAKIEELATREENLEGRIGALNPEKTRFTQNGGTTTTSFVISRQTSRYCSTNASDRSGESGEIMLKLLHTADWHLGRRFRPSRRSPEKALPGPHGRRREHPRCGSSQCRPCRLACRRHLR